eukprot:8628403-Pyramimonas_sp.AAC.1
MFNDHVTAQPVSAEEANLRRIRQYIITNDGLPEHITHLVDVLKEQIPTPVAPKVGSYAHALSFAPGSRNEFHVALLAVVFIARLLGVDVSQRVGHLCKLLGHRSSRQSWIVPKKCPSRHRRSQP